MNIENSKAGAMSWMSLLSVTLVCVAVAAWGCSKSNSVAKLDHDHDHDHSQCDEDHDGCPCHEGHDHDHHSEGTLDDIKANLARLNDADRKLAEAQAFCVVRTSNALGSRGVPYKLTIDGRPVFLCCENCQDAALKDPKATLATLDGLLQNSSASLPKNVK